VEFYEFFIEQGRVLFLYGGLTKLKYLIISNSSREKATKAIKRMKTPRVVVPDHIPIEAWKELGE